MQCCATAASSRSARRSIYDSPVNEFVAGFIGSPSINLVEAELERGDGGLWVKFGDHKLPVDRELASKRPALESYLEKPVILGIRPEDFEDTSLEPDLPQDRRIKAKCDLTEPLGAEVLVYFSVAATGVTSSAMEAEAKEDADVSLGGAEEMEGRTRIVARIDPHTRISEGDQIELAVDTSRLYFFDPETRIALA